MATKTINGSYPTGYYLNPTYQTLDIGVAANVGGSGITASTTQPSTINNLGTTNGIVLADGGTITNGSATNTTALIGGTDPIKTGTAGAGAATIINYAVIKSDPSPSGYAYPNYHASIVMNGGGKLTNEAGATITNGVSVANARGTVINNGYIGGPISVKVPSSDNFVTKYGAPSVQMADGGSVTNGVTGDLKSGVAISGAVGTVINDGYIGATQVTVQGFGSNIFGTAVTVSDGGKIVNGSSTNATATIEGLTAIQVAGATGTVTNYGQIKSALSFPESSNYRQNYQLTVAFESGGTVTNKSGALISNGISIGGVGTVVNDGAVGGAVYWGRSGYSPEPGMTNQYFYDPDTFPSVEIFGGGKVTNGTGSNTSSILAYGIYISGGIGTVINNGTIGSPSYFNYSYKTAYGDAVFMRAGGSVTNGSATNSTADIAGTVRINGGNGTVTNYGEIYAVTIGGNGTVKNLGTMGGVAFGAGGSVTNGSANDFTATITTGGNGIVIKEPIPGTEVRGKITNFGSIVSTTLPGGPIYSAVELDSGGFVTNGSASDRIASIEGIVGITLMEPGTITNFGLVVGTGGTAIEFTSAKGNLTEEGGSTISGAVVGVGGTLEFAANGGLPSVTDDVSGFKSILIDTGASWVLFGSATAASPTSLLSNAGTLFNHGHMTLSGQMSNSGSILNSANSSIDVVRGVTNAGSIANGANATLSFGDSVTNGGAITNASNATASFTGSVTNSGAISNAGNGSVEFEGAITNHGSIINASGGTIRFDGLLANSGIVGNEASGAVIDIGGQVVNSGTIANNPGGTIDLLGDTAITTDPATKTGNFENDGLLEKTGGTGTGIVRTGNAELENYGIIDVEIGTLELTGKVSGIGGTIEGPGTIEFGPGNTTLAAAITTGRFVIAGTGAHVTSSTSLSYSRAFAMKTNAELTLASPGKTWTLGGSASFSQATIDGFGKIVTDGTTSLTSTTLGGNAQWDNGGTLTETGPLTVAADHSIAFTNDTGAVFDLAGNVGIDGTGMGGFANAGLLAKTVGSASTIAIALANTGTVEVGSGMIDLTRAVTGSGGTLQIDSGKILQADAAVGTGQTVQFKGTADKLTLTDAADFHAKLSGFAATDKLDLTEFGAGSSLAFSGNASQGILTVTDGALQAKLSLLGQYAAAGFHIGTDGHSGSLITYTPPPSPNLADHLSAPAG